MSISMNSKYYEMHTEVLDMCIERGLRMIPGKRVAYEIMSREELPGIKEFLLVPDDMETFIGMCIPELEGMGYRIEKENVRGGIICRIIREDMLATTVPAVMNNPAGRHSPQFIVRELMRDDNRYKFTANGVTNSFDMTVLDVLNQTEYMRSFVYISGNIEEHLKVVCGMDITESVTQGYFLFSTECSSQEFLEEAKKRGYLSAERIGRHKKYREWRKKYLAPNDKANKEYRDTFLGIKQP